MNFIECATAVAGGITQKREYKRTHGVLLPSWLLEDRLVPTYRFRKSKAVKGISKKLQTAL